jgi:uncharacterized protein (TIGR00725 family)
MENKSQKIKQISYFGFADADKSDPLYKEAYECAKFLASKGYDTINGGGPGTMRAFSEGAKASGGKVTGVTFYPKDITNFEGRDPQNPIDQEIVTANYLERTLKLLELGDAYIAFKGGTGTISEFGMAWGLGRLYFEHHKPLLLYGEFWNNIISAFVANMRIRPEELKVYRVVNSPEEAYHSILLFEELIKEQEHPHEPERPFQLSPDANNGTV